MLNMCTRIWWRRPVFGYARTSVCAAKRSITSYSVDVHAAAIDRGAHAAGPEFLSGVLITAFFFGDAVQQRDMGSLHLAVGGLVGQEFVRLGVFRVHDQSGRVLVEHVHGEQPRAGVLRANAASRCFFRRVPGS